MNVNGNGDGDGNGKQLIFYFPSKNTWMDANVSRCGLLYTEIHLFVSHTVTQPPAIRRTALAYRYLTVVSRSQQLCPGYVAEDKCDTLDELCLDQELGIMEHHNTMK